MDIPAKPFRFGVVATPHAGPDRWIATARRVEELGYTTLLMPDGIQLPSPFPALAIAAQATQELRVGTFVLAAPLRTPYQAAYEAHSLSVLTAGRFDLGIGTGRPVVERQAATVGLPFGTAAERRAQVERTIATLRELDGDAHRTPVLMAARGPKALRLAARLADTVTLAADARAGRSEVAAMAAAVRTAAGERAADIELAVNVFVVGDELPPQMARYIGVDMAELVAVDSMALLRGGPGEIVDELRRRRDTTGISAVSVSEPFLEVLAPVVERLTGT